MFTKWLIFDENGRFNSRFSLHGRSNQAAENGKLDNEPAVAACCDEQALEVVEKPSAGERRSTATTKDSQGPAEVVTGSDHASQMKTKPSKSKNLTQLILTLFFRAIKVSLKCSRTA